MLPAMKACAERLTKIAGVSRRIMLVLTDGKDDYSTAADAAPRMVALLPSAKALK